MMKNQLHLLLLALLVSFGYIVATVGFCRSVLTLVPPHLLQASYPTVGRDLIDPYGFSRRLDLLDQDCVHPDIETLLGHAKGYTKMM